jgi:hypothetical protein
MTWLRRLTDWLVPDRALRWECPTPDRDLPGGQVADVQDRHAGWTVADFHAASNHTTPRCRIHGTVGGGISFCRYRMPDDTWCGQPLTPPVGGPPYRVHVSRAAITANQSGADRPVIVVRGRLATGGETFAYHRHVTILCPACGTPAGSTRHVPHPDDGVTVWIDCDRIHTDG